MNEDVQRLKERVAELDTQIQILAMAIRHDDTGSQHPLGRLFIRMGLNPSHFTAYYRFLDSVVGERSLEAVLAAFLRHFPNHQPVDLLEIGIAKYQTTPGSPAARLFMEAGLRGMREQEAASGEVGTQL